jgi:N-dimethylarginine dimethylaminohydrolase
LVRLAVGLEDIDDVQGGHRARIKMSHVFLMCPPEYFTVAYIINPWMHGNLRKIDNAVAKQQWRSLYDTLTDAATGAPRASAAELARHGVHRERGAREAEPLRGSRFRYPERQARSRTSPTGSRIAATKCPSCRATCPFEGAGDALFDRGTKKRLWMAHGHRSISAAREIIEEPLRRRTSWC